MNPRRGVVTERVQPLHEHRQPAHELPLLLRRQPAQLHPPQAGKVLHARVIQNRNRGRLVGLAGGFAWA